jgi:hypothetical protein
LEPKARAKIVVIVLAGKGCKFKSIATKISETPKGIPSNLGTKLVWLLSIEQLCPCNYLYLLPQ